MDGQKYEPHHDFFHDSVNQAPELGGQRVATVLMYLCGPLLLQSLNREPSLSSTCAALSPRISQPTMRQRWACSGVATTLMYRCTCARVLCCPHECRAVQCCIFQCVACCAASARTVFVVTRVILQLWAVSTTVAVCA